MGVRRERKAGSLIERSPGVWRVRVYVGVDPMTGHPRQLSRTVRGNKTAALRVIRQLTVEVEAGKHLASSQTVGRLLNDYLKHKERVGMRETTLLAYGSIVKLHATPHLGKMMLRNITARDLDDYYAAMAEEGLSPGTIRLHHAMLSGAFTQAIKWQQLDRNPSRGATPPGRQPTSRHAPTPAEVAKLVMIARADEDWEIATAVYVAAATGMRRGELCGLKWSDVNWDVGAITVERARVPVTGGDITGPTKKGDTRVVAVDQGILVILRAYREELAIRMAKLGVDMPDDGWLLSYDGGVTPMRTKALTEKVTALGRRAGVPVTLHELRHYTGTQMVGKGTDIRTAAGRLGHNPDILVRVYTHALPEQDRAAARMLEEVLERALAAYVTPDAESARDREIAGTLGRAISPAEPV